MSKVCTPWNFSWYFILIVIHRFIIMYKIIKMKCERIWECTNRTFIITNYYLSIHNWEGILPLSKADLISYINSISSVREKKEHTLWFSLFFIKIALIIPGWKETLQEIFPEVCFATQTCTRCQKNEESSLLL